MDVLAADPSSLAMVAANFILAVARLSFVVFMMPGFGETVVPVRVRLTALLGLAACVTANELVQFPPSASLTAFAGALVGEAALGLMLGFTLRLSIWVLSITGAIIAQTIGLSQFLGVGLDESEAQTLTANLLAAAGAALLLSVNFHLEAISAYFSLYQDVPIGDWSRIDVDFLLRGAFKVVEFAILISWPFVVLNLVYNISLGFINRALPQLMVAFVGAPFLIGAGILLLMLSIVVLMTVWAAHAPELRGWG